MSYRQRRGRESELAVADWLRDHGHSNAHATSNWVPGADILGTPYSIEVKARARLDLPSWIRQTRKQAGGKPPLLIVRLNKQGVETVGSWLAIQPLEDWLGVTLGETPLGTGPVERETSRPRIGS